MPLLCPARCAAAMRCRAPPARSAAALWGAPWRAAVIPVRAGLRAAPRRRLCAAPKAPAAEAPAKPPAAPKPGTGLPRVAAQGSGGKADGTPTQSQGPITWKNFLLAMSLGGSITLVFKYMEMRLAEDRFRTVGKAALGGPFELLDQDGEPCSDVDLHGGWALLYFGFTFCPDICPNELQKITAVVRPPPSPPSLNGEQRPTGCAQVSGIDSTWWAGPILKPVLITVDPRRDSVPKMKDYIKQFHPRFIGDNPSRPPAAS